MQQTNVLAVHRTFGPTVPQGNTATVITLTNVPPGNYVALAKTQIRVNMTTSEYANCLLLFTPPGNSIYGGVADQWTEESSATVTSYIVVANLQGAITLNPAISTSYTVMLTCSASTSAAGNADYSNSSLILTQTQNLQFSEVNS